MKAGSGILSFAVLASVLIEGLAGSGAHSHQNDAVDEGEIVAGRRSRLRRLRRRAPPIDLLHDQHNDRRTTHQEHPIDQSTDFSLRRTGEDAGDTTGPKLVEKQVTQSRAITKPEPIVQADNAFGRNTAPPHRSDTSTCNKLCKRKGNSRRLRQRCISKCKARRCNKRVVKPHQEKLKGQSGSGFDTVRFYVRGAERYDGEDDEYFTIILRESWAPKGYKRFKELVNSCFFDDSPFFRVVDGFIAQFGISTDKRANKKWRLKNIEDDPRVQGVRNEKGTLSFANSGPNSRTTQIFINLDDNLYLDDSGFTPFATVLNGWDLVTRLFSGYGEDGPDQGTLNAKGSKVGFKTHPKLSKITRVEFI